VRYGIISDIHGNLEALEAALAALEGAEAFICLGDIVGYGPNPNECVARVRALPDLICIAGNHDLAAVGAYDLDWFNPLARAAVLWTREQLEPAHLAYLESLPLRVERPRVTIVHGALPEPMDYILSSIEARQTFAEFTTPLCLVGHTHVAEYWVQVEGQHRVEHGSLFSGGEVKFEPGKRYIVNCGGIGQPRDGNSQAAFGLYDEEAQLVRVRRVPYALKETQRKMRRAGLPEMLTLRLEHGR
jgi:diadenosine tetraphosphatase ApaH/serine/threonine PP2A family protein phosphatase